MMCGNCHFLRRTLCDHRWAVTCVLEPPLCIRAHNIGPTFPHIGTQFTRGLSCPYEDADAHVASVALATTTHAAGTRRHTKINFRCLWCNQNAQCRFLQYLHATSTDLHIRWMQAACPHQQHYNPTEHNSGHHKLSLPCCVTLHHRERQVRMTCRQCLQS